MCVCVVALVLCIRGAKICNKRRSPHIHIHIVKENETIKELYILQNTYSVFTHFTILSNIIFKYIHNLCCSSYAPRPIGGDDTLPSAASAPRERERVCVWRQGKATFRGSLLLLHTNHVLCGAIRVHC